LSFLDQAMEQEFLISSAQLPFFIPVLDPSMSRINWSTMESHKKLRLDLSLRLWNLVSYGFINSILFYFVISYIYLSVFQVCQCSLFQVMSSILYLSTLRHWGQCRFGWGERVVVDIIIKNLLTVFSIIKTICKTVVTRMTE